MLETFLLSLIVTGVNQLIKLIMRVAGVSKGVATKTIMVIGLVLSVAFTYMIENEVIDQAKIETVTTMFLLSVGNYTIFLKKFGFDGKLKEAFGIRE